MDSQITFSEGSFSVPGFRENLYYRSYKKNRARKARILILQHGIGEHSGRYEHVMREAALNGYATYALDQIGFGQSPGKRGVIHSFDDYIQALKAFTDFVLTEENQKTAVLFGHSMGGLIAWNTALKYPALYSGLALSAPAIHIHQKPSDKLKVWIGRKFAPLFPTLQATSGIHPELLSHDKEMHEKSREDKLNHNKISLRLGDELFRNAENVLDHAGEWKKPIYIFHGLEDKTVEPSGSQELFDKIVTKDKTLKLFPGLYHETFNETPRERAAVLADLMTWLKDHAQKTAASVKPARKTEQKKSTAGKPAAKTSKTVKSTTQAKKTTKAVAKTTKTADAKKGKKK